MSHYDFIDDKMMAYFKKRLTQAPRDVDSVEPGHGHVEQHDAAGELVGGLFYFNYPGGTGLVSGAVFGKLAGASAGRAAS